MQRPLSAGPFGEAKRHLLEAFHRLDKPGNGTVPCEVFAKLLGSVMGDGPNVPAEIEQLLRFLDPSGTGQIQYEDFTKWVMTPDTPREDESSIRYRSSPYERVEGEKVIHLKGFGGRISNDSVEAQALRSKLIDFMASETPVEVVWDGDSYAADSFTHLLPDVVVACGGTEKVRLTAFLREKDQGRFQDAWSPLALPITVYLQDASIDFTELGGIALKATQSRLVVCFGGGGVVKDEFAKIPSEVIFHLFPVTRPTADKTGTEQPSLLASQGAPNLVVH